MKTKIFFPLIIFLFHFIYLSKAQDSLLIESELSFETRGQHNIVYFTKNLDCINCPSGRVGDNPLFHLAIFSGIEHKLILNKQYSIITGIFLEERSQSGGNNTLDNIVVFPKILIEVNDTIKIKNKTVFSTLKGGDLWNEDVSDFLRIYNVDYQGLIGKFRMGNVSLNFMSIGDLSTNVGLNLHQTYRFDIDYFFNSYLKNNLSITLNELSSFKSDYNLSNYTSWHLSKHLKIESQAEMRLNKAKSYPIALGLKANYIKSKFQINVALRYYDEAFNENYNGYFPRYYLGGSYVGPQLYPLKNFYRNYSQWALYTHNPSSDLITAEITSSYNLNLYKKLGAFCEVDVNYIYKIEKVTGNFIPFYNTGLKINFAKPFTSNISITNKHLDLREPYQTFAASYKPFLSLAVHLKIDAIKLKSYALNY